MPGDYNARAHLWDNNENPRGKKLKDWYYGKNNKHKLLNNVDDHTTFIALRLISHLYQTH